MPKPRIYEAPRILALRVLKAIFEIPLAPYQGALATMLPDVKDSDLTAMVLTPADVSVWPRPSDMLRATCADTRFILYKELGWYASSELCRKAFRGLRLSRDRVTGR